MNEHFRTGVTSCLKKYHARDRPKWVLQSLPRCQREQTFNPYGLQWQIFDDVTGQLAWSLITALFVCFLDRF